MNGITRNTCLQEDLLQEATIHLWKLERDRPGQSLSWYLQGCSFHLRHYLAAGRSIDSSKRGNRKCEWPEDESGSQASAWPVAESPVPGQVHAREIVRLLSLHLKPRDRTVLHCLAEGQGVREIARHLNLSHPVTIKVRRKIAALASRLGIEPV